MLPITKNVIYSIPVSEINKESKTLNDISYVVQNQPPPDSSNLDSLVSMEVCRICLAMDVKMYDMSDHQLHIMFERVTGIEINADNKLPQKLCWECVARLGSANNFVEKVLKTQWVLFNIINSRKFTMISGIETIKEAKAQLKPTLSKVSKVNDYYLSCVNDKEETTINGGFEEIQIKNEHVDIDFEVTVAENEAVNNGIFEVKLENNIEEFDIKVENLSDEVPEENQNEIFGENLPDVQVDNYKQQNQIINTKQTQTSENYPAIKPFLNNTDKTTINKDPEKFICDLCGKIFWRKSIFINHIFKHPKTYTCTYCPYKAPNKTRYNQHLNAKHTKIISFKCSFCNYTSNFKQSLSRHINSKHSIKHIHECSLCNYKTDKEKALGKHVSTRHTSKLYQCSLCNYTTNVKYTLAQHISFVHDKSKSFKCSSCKFKSFYKTSLDRHVRLFHS